MEVLVLMMYPMGLIGDSKPRVKKTVRWTVFTEERCRNFSHLREHKVRDGSPRIDDVSDGSPKEKQSEKDCFFRYKSFQVISGVLLYMFYTFLSCVSLFSSMATVTISPITLIMF
jgi:hypothetical protein